MSVRWSVHSIVRRTHQLLALESLLKCVAIVDASCRTKRPLAMAGNLQQRDGDFADNKVSFLLRNHSASLALCIE